MNDQKTRMVIRTNLVSPDIIIPNDDQFEENVRKVYEEAKEVKSVLYMDNEYLRFRYTSDNFKFKASLYNLC